ncbi:hypothetical protein KCP69_04590 [Salmonella enterica subsp. enterica]|nr:hypothetical protein KCP69_04590 [Salmonella enterica subsp. enterica]
MPCRTQPQNTPLTRTPVRCSPHVIPKTVGDAVSDAVMASPPFPTSVYSRDARGR